MSKHSDDYQNLMKLIHDDGYKLVKTYFHLEKAEAGDFMENSEFTLEKNKKQKVIKSKEEDLARLVWALKTFPTIDSEQEFREVNDISKYYDDIQHLVDEGGVKIKQAFEELAKGSFQFKYNPEDLLENFLNETKNKNRSSTHYLRLKSDYYFILIHYINTLKSLLAVYEKIGKENINFDRYKDFFFQKLMKFSDGRKEIYRYRQIVKHMHFNPVDKVSIYSNLKKDSQEVFAMINAYYGNSVHASKVISRLLDMYRKSAEFTSDYIEMFARIEHEIEGLEFDENSGFSGNYYYLQSKKDYSDILKSLDPEIRHSESHLNTKTGEELNKIVITELKNRKRITLREYSYQEFSEMLKSLDNELALALVISALSAFLISIVNVLESYEYKVLLVGIGNRK